MNEWITYRSLLFLPLLFTIKLASTDTKMMAKQTMMIVDFCMIFAAVVVLFVNLDLDFEVEKKIFEFQDSKSFGRYVV